MRRTPDPMTNVLVRDKRRRRERKDHVKTDTQMEGCGHKPRGAWSPRKLEEAGRAVPWSLRRELSPLISDSWSGGLGARSAILSQVCGCS